MIAQLKDVHRYFRKGESLVKAVNGVSLAIYEGEIVAIMGPSGSGKSTLMYLLGGLMRPSGGEVWLHGVNVSKLDDYALSAMRLRTVGFVFQSYNLIPDLSALENVALPMAYARVSKQKRLRRAEELLTSVGLAHRLGHYPSELSGGEEQRVAIARALANEPRLVLADEPTGNVDSATREQLLDLLAHLCDQGHTVVIVTHDPTVADRAGRVLRMEDGRLEVKIAENSTKRVAAEVPTADRTLEF